ncbi:type III-A CRISPR-associated protein Csm2 [Sulfurihydrogenibium azorense]|uniref:type III-A CRISPR-associated protein Csm2 n=1 Tax=Sulfurihydrogenibium azorense TaxID=309806 RepID=UPI00391C74B9
MNGRNPNQQKNNGQDNSFINTIVQKIKSAQKLSDVLTPKEFAPIGGWADEITKKLKSELSTSQLRKIFIEIKSICDDREVLKNKTRLYLLYPKLAYAKGRKLIPNEFYDLIIACLDKLKDGKADEEDFKNFGDFMTAIVAYNKQYEKN